MYAPYQTSLEVLGRWHGRPRRWLDLRRDSARLIRRSLLVGRLVWHRHRRLDRARPAAARLFRPTALMHLDQACDDELGYRLPKSQADGRAGLWLAALD